MPLMQPSPSKSELNRTATRPRGREAAPSGLTAVTIGLACRMSRRHPVDGLASLLVEVLLLLGGVTAPVAILTTVSETAINTTIRLMATRNSISVKPESSPSAAETGGHRWSSATQDSCPSCTLMAEKPGLVSLDSVGAVVKVNTPVGKPRSPLLRAGRTTLGRCRSLDQLAEPPPVAEQGVGRVPDVAARCQDRGGVDARVVGPASPYAILRRRRPCPCPTRTVGACTCRRWCRRPLMSRRHSRRCPGRGSRPPAPCYRGRVEVARGCSGRAPRRLLIVACAPALVCCGRAGQRVRRTYPEPAIDGPLPVTSGICTYGAAPIS